MQADMKHFSHHEQVLHQERVIATTKYTSKGDNDPKLFACHTVDSPMTTRQQLFRNQAELAHQPPLPIYLIRVRLPALRMRLTD